MSVRKRPRPSRGRLHLQDLVNADILRPKSRVTTHWKQHTLHGTVTPNGKIRYQNKVCKSPTGFYSALLRLHGDHKSNVSSGWTRVFHKNKPLIYYRKQLTDRSCEEEDGETDSESEHDIGAEEESDDRFEEDEGLPTDISRGEEEEETVFSVEGNEGEVDEVQHAMEVKALDSLVKRLCKESDELKSSRAKEVEELTLEYNSQKSYAEHVKAQLISTQNDLAVLAASKAKQDLEFVALKDERDKLSQQARTALAEKNELRGEYYNFVKDCTVESLERFGSDNDLDDWLDILCTEEFISEDFADRLSENEPERSWRLLSSKLHPDKHTHLGVPKQARAEAFFVVLKNFLKA